MSDTPAFKPVDSLTYSQAVAELENILRLMQSDACDIDQLAAYTRRATELLGACRARLTATDAELREILASLQ
ncbi:MAG: exodeoxyribonuclease VII small subunit [Bacteroides sp.]|nr:exodeoxyribonuclease VII small subunit [Bacteroides sp.]MBD5377388.1 exodeoxyribonuclease VII small subunit [Bacteroides sp.]